MVFAYSKTMCILTHTLKILRDMEFPYPTNILEISSHSLSGVKVSWLLIIFILQP